MIDVVIDRFQNSRNQLFTQPFPFLINIDITATGEIDTFERTSMILAWLVNLRSTDFTFFAD